MSQFPRHPVLSCMETSIHIDGIAESGSKIHAQYGLILLRVQIVFLDVVTQEIIHIPVHKHPDSQLFLQKMPKINILKPPSG